MTTAPILLVPAFRYGKETPWGGDLLNRLYGKFAVGTKIGESGDFCRESTFPDGSRLAQTNLLGYRYPSPPFSLKWIDCAGQQHFHCHPGSEEYLYVIKAYNGARVDIASQADRFISHSLGEGDLICIPQNTLHALSGALCIQFTGSDFSTLRSDTAPYSINFENCNQHIDLRLAPKSLNAHTDRLLQTDFLCVYELTNCETLSMESREDFFLITCLSDSVIRTKERSYYLGKGQTVLIPPHCTAFTLSGEHLLLSSPT